MPFCSRSTRFCCFCHITLHVTHPVHRMWRWDVSAASGTIHCCAEPLLRWHTVVHFYVTLILLKLVILPSVRWISRTCPKTQSGRQNNGFHYTFPWSKHRHIGVHINGPTRLQKVCYFCYTYYVITMLCGSAYKFEWIKLAHSSITHNLVNIQKLQVFLNLCWRHDHGPWCAIGENSCGLGYFLLSRPVPYGQPFNRNTCTYRVILCFHFYRRLPSYVQKPVVMIVQSQCTNTKFVRGENPGHLLFTITSTDFEAHTIMKVNKKMLHWCWVVG